jgi:hypothetical protein
MGAAMRLLLPALLAIGALSAAFVSPAKAAQQESQPLACMTPRATIDPRTHDLNRVWIDVFSKPSATASLESFKVASPLPLWVLARSGTFLQVATGDSVDDWPFKPHATLGWVRAVDLQDQDLRNCT